MKLKHKTMVMVLLAILILAVEGLLVHVFNANIMWQRFFSIVSFGLILVMTCMMIHGAEKMYIRKIPRDGLNHASIITGARALSRFFQILAVTIFIFIVLGILQIPVSALLTVGGIGGIALAYAGKDVLTNSLGGLMIYVNRQFVIDEEVSSPDRDIAGKIEEMGWRFTTIRRKNGDIMYVPNSVLTDIVIVNSSRNNKPKGKKK